MHDVFKEVENEYLDDIMSKWSLCICEAWQCGIMINEGLSMFKSQCHDNDVYIKGVLTCTNTIGLSKFT